MGIVNQPVEDAICHGRIADLFVPTDGEILSFADSMNA
jgi:hypothetical protein